MDSFVILTDSASSLPYAYVKKYDIRVMPLKYVVGEQEYPGFSPNSGETFQMLYAYLKNGKQVTTSMVNNSEAYQMAKEILQEGKDLLYIGLSSKLSGTFEAVEAAFIQLKGEHPERNMYAVDSLSQGLGEGLLIYEAVKMKKSGKSIQEIYRWCKKNRWKVTALFTVDDLSHLRRSGRASSVIAAVGTVLKIKPVLRQEGGVLYQEAKVRGRRKSLEEIAKRAAEKIRKPQMVFISHGDCPEDAVYLADRLRKSGNVKKVIINILDPVIGVHTGPGSIGVFFIKY